ncbi:MAG: YqgE/AlgH family protein [Rubripirellula sp.]
MNETFADHSFMGSLLVASSLVQDPIYSGGVCLLVHQDDQQVYGVMLNRPLKPNLGALMAMLNKPKTSRLPEPSAEASEAGELSDVETAMSVGMPAALPNLGMVHFGGPLSGPVVALHQDSQFAEAEPGSGIYLAAQKQHLESLLAQHPSSCRLIVGHLRWDIDQLDSELDAGLWHTAPATADVVFGEPDEMWPRLIRRATARSLARWVGTPDVIGASELN